MRSDHNGKNDVCSKGYHGSESQLFLSAVDANTTGVYQCVVRDAEDNWISAQSVVSLESQRPIGRGKLSVQILMPDARPARPCPPIAPMETLWAFLFPSPNIHPADYGKLIQTVKHPKEWHTDVYRASSSQLISLSCLPPEPYLTELTHWLVDILPGRGTVSRRLQLAHQLGLISVHWRKDGVQLQLPTPTDGSTGPLQLNMTATRSVDLGSYRCDVSVPTRHVLFSHETRLKPVTLADEGNFLRCC
ncbi:hypothetical protein FGIG_07337 [Fasciola gigantica]|uniref:Ig-like domain-containing protein n=1 Tax=Fasciola gigantica TaxID=46835 RepID=A0A504YGF1_FASGI|nr:hypothetical protein FGIG_07337 [Fasciola gigantica]